MKRFNFVIVLALSLAFLSCDDGTGGTTGGGNTSLVNWPSDFFYHIGPTPPDGINTSPLSGVWHTVTEPNKINSNLTFTQGTVSSGRVHWSDTEFRLISIQGKKITVRCTTSPGSNIATAGRDYIFCTDYFFSDDGITLIGSTISDRRLGPVITRGPYSSSNR